MHNRCLLVDVLNQLEGWNALDSWGVYRHLHQSEKCVKTHEILALAADVLDADGWCQLANSYPSGERCASSAVLEVACVARGDWQRALAVLERHLGESTIRWNDTPGRTKEEVTSTLRMVAAMERMRVAKTVDQSPDRPASVAPISVPSLV